MRAVYNTLGLNRVDDKSTNITDKITFRYAADGVNFVELKRGQPVPFTSAGRKLIEIQYKGITEETYWITIKMSLAPVADTGARLILPDNGDIRSAALIAS